MRIPSICSKKVLKPNLSHSASQSLCRLWEGILKCSDNSNSAASWPFRAIYIQLLILNSWNLFQQTHWRVWNFTVGLCVPEGAPTHPAIPTDGWEAAACSHCWVTRTRPQLKHPSAPLSCTSLMANTGGSQTTQTPCASLRTQHFLQINTPSWFHTNLP